MASCADKENYLRKIISGDVMNGIQQDNDSQLLHRQESLQLSQFSGEVPATSVGSPAEQSAVKLGIQAAQHWPGIRMTRLAVLRTRVQAGTYQLKSQELAKCLLVNETHFFSDQSQ